jgi:hypothetical protein
MIARIVLGEDEEEQALPLVVVAGGVIHLELDVAGDVDAVRGGRGVGLDIKLEAQRVK